MCYKSRMGMRLKNGFSGFYNMLTFTFILQFASSLCCLLISKCFFIILNNLETKTFKDDFTWGLWNVTVVKSAQFAWTRTWVWIPATHVKTGCGHFYQVQWDGDRWILQVYGSTRLPQIMRDSVSEIKVESDGAGYLTSASGLPTGVCTLLHRCTHM